MLSGFATRRRLSLNSIQFVNFRETYLDEIDFIVRNRRLEKWDSRVITAGRKIPE